jgi:hypothetical protein
MHNRLLGLSNASHHLAAGGPRTLQLETVAAQVHGFVRCSRLSLVLLVELK